MTAGLAGLPVQRPPVGGPLEGPDDASAARFGSAAGAAAAVPTSVEIPKPHRPAHATGSSSASGIGGAPFGGLPQASRRAACSRRTAPRPLPHASIQVGDRPRRRPGAAATVIGPVAGIRQHRGREPEATDEPESRVTA